MSNASVREIRESPWEQGADEERDYVLDTGPWGGSPSSVVVKLFADDGEDVTDTLISGEPSINGDTVVTGLIGGLEVEREYRLEILFEHAGRVEEAWGIIICTK